MSKPLPSFPAFIRMAETMSKKNREKRINSKSEIPNPNPQLLNPKPLLLALLLVIIAPIVTYWNSLEGEFHFDDYRAIVENPNIKSFDRAFGLRTRFVTDVSLAIDYSLGKLDTKYYHAQQIFWHIINCLLIYFIVLLTLHRVGINKNYLAFLTSLFFALHPINTEPVNYIISGRAMILCTFFYLLGMLLFILAFEAGKRKWLYFGGCFISYILSVFSKEVGITLPAVLFFYYLYFICDSKKTFLRALALFGMAMALVIIYAFWYGMPEIIKTKIPKGAVSPFIALMVELLTQLNVATTYLKLYTLPLPSFLNVDHFIQFIPHSADASSFTLEAQTIFSIIIIAGLIFVTIITYKKHRLTSFSLVYLFITHSPTTLPTRKGEIIAEYKNYLPFFGFAFLAILCLSKIFSYPGLGKNCLIVTVLIILLFFAFVVVERNEVWETDLTLWGDAIAKAPDNPRGYRHRGNAKSKINDYKGAITDFDKAIEIDPNYFLTYNNRGIAKGSLDDYRGALADFDKAIELNPRNAEVYANRGFVKGNLGNLAGAIKDWEKAIEIEPSLKDQIQSLINDAKARISR